MSGKSSILGHSFECPPLTSEEIASYKYMAYKNAMELVRKSRIDSELFTWTLLSQENELKLYKGEDLACEPGYTLHCGVLEVPGTMSEIVALVNDTESENNYFHPGTIDGRRLYSILEPTEEFPRQKLSISWRAIATKFAHVAKRDCCLIESCHDFEYNGEKGWVYSMRSIDAPFCPSLEASHGLVRMKNYGSGRVFVHSNQRPGYIKMIYINHVDMQVSKNEWVADALGGRSWFTDMMAKWRSKKLGDIDRRLRENRLNRTPFLARTQLVPKSTQTQCFLCHKNFGPLSKKSNCSKCGQVVCKKCNEWWQVNVNRSAAKKRVCTKCSITGGPPLENMDKFNFDVDDEEDALSSPANTATASSFEGNFDMEQCMEYLTTNASFLSVDGTYLSTRADYDPSIYNPDEPVIEIRVGEMAGRSRELAFIEEVPWE